MSHLPALQMVEEFQVTALADLESDTARKLAQTYGIPVVVGDHRELTGYVDAAIIALPHHFHLPVALDLMEAGIHVLVEKPMAMTCVECDQMLAASRKAGVRLAVGHMRRYFDSYRLLKQLLDLQAFGKVLSFEAEEAVLFERFKASAFTVKPPAGGVLFDTGPHIIDLLLWLLGDFASVNYWDDARGGVEANSRLEIEVKTGVHGTVELSRTRELQNVLRICCELGTLEVEVHHPAQLLIKSELYTDPLAITKQTDGTSVRRLEPYFAAQLRDFAQAILNHREPFTSGEEGRRSVQVMEHCRQVRQQLGAFSWPRLDDRILARINQ